MLNHRYERRYLPGELLQMYRRRAGLTQTKLAELIGLKNKRMIQSWEVGESLPKSDRLKQLIALYLERKVLVAGQELEEAQLLWLSVKDMYDTNTHKRLTYAVFDLRWFEILLKAQGETKSEPTTGLPRTNLPTPPNGLIGREKELEEICGLIRTGSGRLITLTGEGGIGKTRLALEVARQMLPTFADGVWLVELATLNDPALVSQEIAEVLRLPERQGQPLLASLARFLERKSLLLILDNCEHQLAECVKIVSQLLAACPDLVIVCTSRQTLKVAGEINYRVIPLSLPDPNITAASRIAEYNAIRLFTERVKAIYPQFKLEGSNARLVAEICNKLEGIPFALELAAIRLRVLNLEQLNARLNNRFQVLIGGKSESLQRQQTLGTLIDWSYELLSEKEQKLWQRLAVFEGSWRLEAARQVCSGDQLDEKEVADLVLQLADKSILSKVAHEEDYFAMLATIREYGSEKLKESGTASFWQERHLNYYVKLAEQLNLAKISQASLKLLEKEENNLRAALEWALEEKEKYIEQALRLVKVLESFWEARGYFGEGRRYRLKLGSALEEKV